MTVSLILAESALETVPPRICRHPAVASHARRTGKQPLRMLLDVSWHYAAMRRLEHFEKRGRPDLVHLAMVTALSTPMYRLHDMLKVYVHTINDNIIRMGPRVRMPKSYHRFAGLVESLYGRNDDDATASAANMPKSGSEYDDADDDARRTTMHGKSGPDSLMALVRNQTFAQFVTAEKFYKVVGLSSAGLLPDSRRPFEAVAGSIMCNENASNNVAIVIGGFQRGHFSEKTIECVDELYAVDANPLEAHVVIARILYECEQMAGCPADADMAA